MGKVSAAIKAKVVTALGKHAQYVFQCGATICFVACFSIDFSLWLLTFLFPGHLCSTLSDIPETGL